MRLPQIEYAFVDERKVRANNDIKSVMETQFGSKYVIEGPWLRPMDNLLKFEQSGS